MRLGGETVAEPVFARDGHVQQRGTQVKERHIKPPAIEGHNGVIMLGDIPKGREQLDLVHTGNELHRPGLGGLGIVILGGEQHLAARSLGVEHGDAYDLRGEGPKVELQPDFGAARFAGGFVGNLAGLAEKIFLLRFVKIFQRQRGSLDVKNQFGHGREGGRSRTGRESLF